MKSNRKPSITVLTATYNREKTLGRLFLTLQSQTYFDFEWLIINDGSTDGTLHLLEQLHTNNFEIRIYNQENIGLNQTINRGVQLAEGDLIFRVDSDDTITNDAIEQIINQKARIMDDNKLCALVFLSMYEDGKIVGYHPFNSDLVTNFFDYRYKYHAIGDRAEVVKRSVYINFPFPKFSNEKFCPEVVMWAKMADEFDALYINRPIYIREYAGDSITASGVKMNLNNPVGATERFKAILVRTNSLKYKLLYSNQYFRWAYKTKIPIFIIIKSVPKISCFLGLIPGSIFHLIDKINPMLLSKMKYFFKRILSI